MGKSREDLYSEIQHLKYDIQRMSGIVQNEHYISSDEIVEWLDSTRETIDKIKQIEREMANYYFNQDTEINETDATLDELKEVLYNADENCKHELVSKSGGGVKCTKCNGWFCY